MNGACGKESKRRPEKLCRMGVVLICFLRQVLFGRSNEEKLNKWCVEHAWESGKCARNLAGLLEREREHDTVACRWQIILI